MLPASGVMALRNRLGFICWIVIQCWVSCAFAEDVVIFGSDQFAPVSYMENGSPKGIFPEILKRMSTVTGDHYIVKLCPWERALRLAQSGAGGVANATWNAKRANDFDYSLPFYNVNVVLVVKKGREFDFKQIDDLKDKVIGIGLGSSYRDEMDAAIASGKVKVDRDPDQQSRMRKLLAGRVDAILVGSGSAGVSYIISQYPDKSVTRNAISILPHPLVTDPLHVMFAKNMKKKYLLQKMNEAYGQLLRSGKLDDLLAGKN